MRRVHSNPQSGGFAAQWAGVGGLVSTLIIISKLNEHFNTKKKVVGMK